MPPDRATRFITAAATGFGREVAAHVLAGGNNVVASEGLAKTLARPPRGPEHGTATTNVRSHRAEIKQWPALTWGADRPDAVGRRWL